MEIKSSFNYNDNKKQSLYYNYEKVKEIIRGLEINLLDLSEEMFKKEKNPNARGFFFFVLFPFGHLPIGTLSIIESIEQKRVIFSVSYREIIKPTMLV